MTRLPPPQGGLRLLKSDAAKCLLDSSIPARFAYVRRGRSRQAARLVARCRGQAQLPPGTALTLTITGIYRDASTPFAGGLGLPALLVSDTVAARHFPPGATGDALLVAATPDADRAALRRDLEAAVADRPDVQVLTTTDYIDGQLGELTSFVRILNGMLAVALLIAFLGIVNTMALSVVERTREIGLLRALGMLRGQVRTMVLTESVLITITGVLVGVGIGMAAGGLTQRAVLGRPAIDLVVPAATIAVTVLALAAAGALAAAWPARHAARTEMLQALTTE